MLAFYSRVAGWLKRIRLVLWLMLFGAAVIFAWGVLNPANPEENPIFLGSVFGFGWTLCLLMIQSYFSQPIERPTPTDSVFVTFQKRLIIALSWGLALAVTGLAVPMMVFTVRALKVWLSNSGGG